MSILLLSTSDNDHASAVEQELRSQGVRVVRFDFDTKYRAVSFQTGVAASDSVNGTNLTHSEVNAVFVHHPIPPSLQMRGVDALDSALMLSGWRNAIDWFEAKFGDAVWMNKPSRSRVAANVHQQLTIASSCGMRVPATIFTNEYEQFEAFAQRHNRTIIKSGPLFGVNLQGKRLLANIIRTEDIKPDALLNSPCLFQEYIEKQFELRVHVIGDVTHACRIDSQASRHTQVDWRNYHISETPHFPFSLDARLSEQCRSITKGLGLIFGILDIIVTPAGEPVFLECNSQGHWTWIEALTGLPITQSVAQALIVSPGVSLQPH
jgi:glutathione synthase/RimK-type ligase-like ATP-grasp enzyme